MKESSTKGPSDRDAALGGKKDSVGAETSAAPAARASETRTFVVPPELARRPLASVLRELSRASWNQVRKYIRTGKVRVQGQVVTAIEGEVNPGSTIEIIPNAPRSLAGTKLDRSAIVYLDAQLVVVRKPAGISTVPYESGERGTLDQLVANLLHRMSGRRGPTASLGVVQRLDKETSGLLVFARTFSAKKILAHQLRMHSMHRIYLAVAHGQVPGRTFRSRLVKDRGDGLRGEGRSGEGGQIAVTHVEPLRALAGATLVRCRLETGRTHQIRIHLAEAGHPLLGERIYTRGYRGAILPAPRVLLHAAELGFSHPTTGLPMRFEDPIPQDFAEAMARLEPPAGAARLAPHASRPTPRASRE